MRKQIERVLETDEYKTAIEKIKQKAEKPSSWESIPKNNEANEFNKKEIGKNGEKIQFINKVGDERTVVKATMDSDTEPIELVIDIGEVYGPLAGYGYKARYTKEDGYTVSEWIS